MDVWFLHVHLSLSAHTVPTDQKRASDSPEQELQIVNWLGCELNPGLLEWELLVFTAASSPVPVYISKGLQTPVHL